MSSNFDEFDRRIIGCLQENARQTNRAIAAEAGLAPSTTLDRIRDLERREVITGYHAEVSLPAMGRPIQAMVAVRLQPKTKQIVDDFVDAVWALPETLAVSLLSGQEDLLVHLSVADTDSLRTLVIDQIASLPGVVDERTSLVFEHRRKTAIGPLEA